MNGGRVPTDLATRWVAMSGRRVPSRVPCNKSRLGADNMGKMGLQLRMICRKSGFGANGIGKPDLQFRKLSKADAKCYTP
ncbi:hypothetical protein HAX54_024421, partial [Datura stramonium]|nr:hypothetical protein [Datura stramonium]